MGTGLKALIVTAGLAATTLVLAPAQAAPHAAKDVCGATSPGTARCHAKVGVDASGAPAASPSPVGLVPADLQSAYKLPTTAGAGKTVAIVDAFDDPNVESDLGVYRAKFGLPACTTANGCFTKIDQRGGTKYPRGDTGWGEEISLDVDMVSAACPDCKILLVEADSAALTDLSAGVKTAAGRGAAAISNSYGGSEYSGETSADAAYHHPGIAVTASSGDSGYGVEYPAASPEVVAVGGTSLSRASNSRGWSETAWSGGGSGCSAYEPKPSWQTDPGCAKRTVADVSAVADPNTGVAVYDTYLHGPSSSKGWLEFGGTSVSSPIVASVYALAGSFSGSAAALPYAHTGSLNDVTSGSNGSCGNYLCTAGAGYDGPTGLGTPNGTGAF
ncbi:peptidase S8 [Amycolatopsis sp. K13G38]|uniref:Peptidase S8 n=1 Tax=Amycolatopsis acididurans TaxID=2724524 RepID=A0ABX1J886_9PSEU|nr:S53 family peptidase [Amycolatopsis acididurans]NKQ55774.1 peptidase S8 [Amycolatopsis acididurans]